MSETKVCIECLEDKPLAAFARKMKTCGRCRWLRSAQHRFRPPAETPAPDRHPEKSRAGKLVRYAISRGLITRPSSCSKCERDCKPDAHHEDYSKPLEVIFLCRECHQAADAARRAREAAQAQACVEWAA